MVTKRVLIGCAAVAAVGVSAVGYGAAASSTRPAGSATTNAATGAVRSLRGAATRAPWSDPTTRSVVYEWGQFGGGGLAPAERWHDRWRGDLARATGSPFGVGPVRPLPHVVHGIRGTVVKIATSNSDDYALTRSGAVYAWGPGRQGELGDGTRVRLSETAVRVRFPTGVRIRSLPNPMPYNGGMAIASNGSAWAWGNDRARQFCRTRGTILTTPVRVRLPDVSLAVGALKHALYDSDGRLVSCGAGPVGQLGNGTSGRSADSGRPVTVRGLPTGRAVALTSGWGNAGALMADGRYYDWGYDAQGQVGDGTTREATTAVRVALPGAAARVFEGGSFGDNGQTLAILANRSVWEWGSGSFGQLGDRRHTDALRPIQLTTPHGVHFVAVNSGGSTDYAVGAHHRLWAWGNNRVDQLGDGSSARSQMTPAPDPLTVRQVASTAHNVAALTKTA